MQRNFTDARGVTDFRFENLRAAVLALLDDLNRSVPPRNFSAKKRAAQRDAKKRLDLGGHRMEFDRPELNQPQTSIYDQQKQDVETARSNKALVETENAINGHHGKWHSRTNAERKMLRDQRDRLIQTGTDPEVIKPTIEKAIREIRPSTLGS